MKKLSYALVGFILLTFLFSFTMNTPLLAQETEKEAEDVMDMALEDLLNVEITTAGKQAEKISEIPASVVLVTREDIEKYGYQTLDEILQNIPGLYMTDDLIFKKFGVRGFWTEAPHRAVIILVNGIAQTDDLYSGYPMESIAVPVEAIDRIEVVRGPMSVIYGTGAFFGVINIKTNLMDQQDNPTSLISASIGSEKTYKLFARASGKEGDFKYTFNAAYFDTEGFDEPYSKMTDPSVLPFFGVPETMTTGGQLENTDKYFNFSGSFKGFSVDASYSETEKEVMFFFPSYSDGTRGYFKMMRFAFGYAKEFSKKVSIDSRLTYFRNSWDWDFDWFFPNHYGVEDDRSAAYQAELNLFLNPTPKLNISIGLNYLSVFEVKNSYTFPVFGLNLFSYSLPKGEPMTTKSIFTQINYKLSDKFKIVLGARMENYPKYTLQEIIGDFVTSEHSLNQAASTESKTEFIPRVALIYSPNENNVFKFLYGKAVSRPSFFQNIDRLWYPGSDGLKPETIQTFELNYFGQLSPKFSVSLSVFRNMLDNLIFRSLIYSGGVVLNYHANVGEMATNGVELTLSTKPFKNFSLELSGTYQDTEDKREGMGDVEVGYSPKFLGYIKAAYSINKNISLAVTGNYVSKMQSYYDVSIPGRLGEEVDGYFLLGANLRLKNLFGKGFFLNIRGSNLFDTEVHYPTTSNNDWASLGTLGKGFSFLVSVGKRF